MGQLLQNITWTTQSPDILAWRFPDPDQILQTHSSVIIGPGQALLFVNEGVPQGIWDKPGRTDIKTANIPILTAMLSIFRGFESKHKGKIFYFNMNDIPNIKWGTKAPLKYADPIYKFPVGMRAFGNYTLKITDPMKFFTEFVGDRDQMTTTEFKEVINGRIHTPITDSLATAKYAFTEIDSKRDELTKEISAKIASEFGAFGFTMKDFRIENTDFDEATQARVNTIADSQAKAQAIGALSGVDQAAMKNYQTTEQLAALNKAASNEGGGAGGAVGAGVGLGAGIGLGGMMAQNMQQSNQQPQQPVTPAAGAVCKACKKPMAAGAQFCPVCGAKQ